MSHPGQVIVRQIIVRGRVQGVGFRAFVEQQAASLSLQGWVRNRRDGTVEALFSGDAAAVRRAIELCRRGPRGARVDSIDEREATAAELGRGFEVLPTV